MLLTEADFNTHIYPEIIAAIDADDEGLLLEAIDAAEGEAKGYLSRYNITSLFTAEGASRDKTLLLFLKDIATWHFATLANPNMNLEFIKARYDDAIRHFKGIQSGKIVPFGWPPATTPEGADQSFHITSTTRRETRY